MKSFGVGCLHFSLNTLRSQITINDYINEISKVLHTLPNVSELSFDYDLNNENTTILPQEEIFLLRNGYECYPQIPFFEMSFNIYIPKRLQSDLTNNEDKFNETGTEYFKVTIKHDWYGPLAFVECINADENSSPSQSVRVIREYLSKEIKKMETFLIFDWVGPSPFHADFYLKKDSDENNKNSFKSEIIKLKGYNKIFFYHSFDETISPHDILNYLFNNLSHEIAFFYSLEVKRIRKSKAWREINVSIQSILDIENNNNFNLKDKFYIKPKTINSTIKSLVMYKADEMFESSTINSEYNSIYKSEKYECFLKDYLDDLIFNQIKYPINETIDLVKFIDQKASKYFELLILFTAAILGGLIGSIITVIFSK